ncbi:hypothetical protein [Kordiimonas aquimaris]|uniref:hypothetical protein n=1 Tax=Kordiimonas aquimaris TaxID=707591 RepID=UPI0021CDF9FE|nr:hypothetical protein [Kordiimonas aquimaris]
MLVFLRIMLLILPILAVALWLRWRSKQSMEDADLQLEAKRFRIGVGFLLVAMVLTGLSLRVFDDGAGDTDSVYVPPHVVDGEVVPGKFVPKDDPETP